MSVVFQGAAAVSVFQAKVIASALRLYAQTGMKANRAYTPTNMLAAASRITGQTFRRGQYMKAHDALVQWAETVGAQEAAKGNITTTG